MEYKLWLRDLFRSYVDNKAVLYTIDGCGQSFFDCGPIPEVYATVDFGISVNGEKLLKTIFFLKYLYILFF